METIDEPGTIEDLVADARRSGYHATPRLVRDWTEVGLLDHPRRRPAGKSHGSRPALYSANQRMLFLTLLSKRGPESRLLRTLARIPIGLWLYWGDDYVPPRQARRAFMTWLGDPRLSRQKARDAAGALLGQLDNPRATPTARRELVKVVAEIAYSMHADYDQLDVAVRAVFEPDHRQIRRAVGHPAAPITTDAVTRLIRARLQAAAWLVAGHVTDEEFNRARQNHLMAFAEYTRQQPELATSAVSNAANFYEAVTPQMMFDNCGNDLLTIIGLTKQQP